MSVDYALSITENKERFIREDGTSYTREDIFVKLSVTFRDNMLAQLKGAKLSVYLCIALFCGQEMQSYPSIDTISKRTGYSEQSVKAALKELQEMGLVEIERRFNEDTNSQQSNLYKVRGHVSMGARNYTPEGVSNHTPEGANGYTPPGVEKVYPKEELSFKKNPSENRVAAAAIAAEPEYVPLDDDGFPEEKPRARRKRGSDPRSKHPAILAYKHVARRMPSKAAYDMVIASLGEEPDIDLMTCCWNEWVARGYNPLSIKWVQDWYTQGGPTGVMRLNPRSAPADTFDFASINEKANARLAELDVS